MKPAIILVQPRHTYAPPPSTGRRGHVYMPTSLLTVAARLLAAGVDVKVCDENLAYPAPLGPLVGINLLGAPYVARARECLARVKAHSVHARLLVGGAVVSGFSRAQLHTLFGSSTANGNDDGSLASAVGVHSAALPVPERTSLVPAYRLLDDATLRSYLSCEFSFYLSQGCRFSCTFCAANRSRRGPPGTYQVVGERYRSMDVVGQDLSYLLGRAADFELSQLTVYLSNLDLFQSPIALGQFAATVREALAQHPQCRLELRGLSTTASFLTAHKHSPGVIKALTSVGLKRVGFGIDGATAKVFTQTRKPQRREMCDEAIRVARTTYGIEPETLMVFGHYGVDDEQSLSAARDFTLAMHQSYGSFPRPHVAKSAVPGNDGWRERTWSGVVSQLLAAPHLFQSLDFTALPSTLTHPDEAIREMATRYFRAVCDMPRCVTQFVEPAEPGMGARELEELGARNEGRYDI